MKTIMNFIGTVMALAGIFLLTCIIATILFVMHWANGVILFFENIGAAQFVEALPLNDPAAANWIMWGVALFTSLSIIGLLIKMVEVVRNSLWTVAACTMMLFVIAFPVYHSYSMGGFQNDEVSETVATDLKTSGIKLPEVNIDFDL